MDHDHYEIAIKVDDISKEFKLPHEKRSSVKSIFVNLFRKQAYERQRVLNNISFEIKKGDFFGIVGRNGSGKSTLLKILAGIYNPTSGEVNTNGKLTPFIELGVGFSPELSGRENVYLNGSLLGFNRKEMDKMYDDIVRFAELEKFMDQKLKNYSSGMQVRLAFSIAIRAKSDILLLDEVLAVGDSAFQQKCFNHFEKLKEEKKTVIFVSHDMAAVTRFCNKAIYLKNGRLTHIGTASEIADIYKIENIEVQSNPKLKFSNKYKLNVKIIKQTQSSIRLRFDYRSKERIKMYLGIALLHEGISIGELTLPPGVSIDGSGQIFYTLDTSVLNRGVYQLASALFNSKDRSALAFGTESIKFIIDGKQEINRGAALKLPDNWTFDPDN